MRFFSTSTTGAKPKSWLVAPVPVSITARVSSVDICQPNGLSASVRSAMTRYFPLLSPVKENVPFTAENVEARRRSPASKSPSLFVSM